MYSKKGVSTANHNWFFPGTRQGFFLRLRLRRLDRHRPPVVWRNNDRGRHQVRGQHPEGLRDVLRHRNLVYHVDISLQLSAVASLHRRHDARHYIRLHVQQVRSADKKVCVCRLTPASTVCVCLLAG